MNWPANLTSVACTSAPESMPAREMSWLPPARTAPPEAVATELKCAGARTDDGLECAGPATRNVLDAASGEHGAECGSTEILSGRHAFSRGTQVHAVDGHVLDGAREQMRAGSGAAGLRPHCP